ncbi:hypothetical protein Cob_v006923 [Colletotrichum orbiculare MAFF 240422]|uniref:Uncharacterized protein n=1 Tax=Colletotrichum orbiculare (strain 104-T / ATCC 96160 / CBS 514.97 / LARS 414 / MAFF 240422) TaxID=1213857 RepID=A0A484FPL0_COLOR|nr:hypothetical protein Cob_v006923 [Colletotrichum orbiculare MAFF 240422]
MLPPLLPRFSSLHDAYKYSYEYPLEVLLDDQILKSSGHSCPLPPPDRCLRTAAGPGCTSQQSLAKQICSQG